MRSFEMGKTNIVLAVVTANYYPPPLYYSTSRNDIVQTSPCLFIKLTERVELVRSPAVSQ